MTLRQEAYREIDRLTDENVRLVITLMRKIQPDAGSREDMSDRKKAFLESAGKIDIDEEAVNELWNGSYLCGQGQASVR